MAANLLLPFEDQQVQEQNHRLWLTVAANTAINFLLFAALIVLMQRPRTIPYVVTVDGKGEPVGVAQPVQGAATFNDAVVKWAISEFIRNAKTVSANLDEEKEHLDRAYAFADGQGRQALDDYYHDGQHYPFTIEQKGWVEVQITRVPLRLSTPDTYQVDWTEKHHQYGGELSSTTAWRATLKVHTVKAESAGTLNPLGLYISTLDWSPEVQE
jgi:type IV secretory pathway TrbF-like protein